MNQELDELSLEFNSLKVEQVEFHKEMREFKEQTLLLANED